KVSRGRSHPFSFIDQYGLVDDTWDRCRHRVPSDSIGKPVSWTSVLRGQCGPLPDVISGRHSLDKVTSGYVVFDQQSGGIRSAWADGGGVNARQWLAVREDLAAK